MYLPPKVYDHALKRGYDLPDVPNRGATLHNCNTNVFRVLRCICNNFCVLSGINYRSLAIPFVF